MENLSRAKLEIVAKLSAPHVKCRLEKPESYPLRSLVPQSFNFADPFYSPSIHLDSKIYGTLNMPIPKADRPIWAQDLPETKQQIIEYLSALPKNPRGTTGITGPGVLGKPQNWAADPVIMSVNLKTGEIYQVQIQRDNGQWAIPGGMVDDGEIPINAARREAAEEAGLTLREQNPIELYKGYCDDYRNTDTHYMMTSVFLYFIPWEDFIEAKLNTNDTTENIKDLQSRKLTIENVNALFASHTDFVKLAIIEIALNAEKYGISAQCYPAFINEALKIVS